MTPSDQERGSDAIVVLTTVGSDEQAEAIASALVGERLAACVNVVKGVKSIYRWEGKIARDEERLLVIKTARARFEALRDRVRALHSYELPEIVALPIVAGSNAYLDWLRGETAE
jgi:uncharacterized protein involved in tolerance to divalent cations